MCILKSSYNSLSGIGKEALGILAFWENKSIHPVCARMLNMILESRNWQFPATTRCGHIIEKLYVFRI